MRITYPPPQSKGSREAGFTLIEIVIVLFVFGVLLAIGVPSYLDFRNRADDSAAQAALRSAVPAIQAYRTDNGTYVGISPALLGATYGSNFNNITIPSATATTYCAQAVAGSATFSITGPDGAIVSGPC